MTFLVFLFLSKATVFMFSEELSSSTGGAIPSRLSLLLALSLSVQVWNSPGSHPY